MKLTSILASITAFAGQRALAAGVTGAAEGFAKGVTGGGSATPAAPKDIKEYVNLYKASNLNFSRN